MQAVGEVGQVGPTASAGNIHLEREVVRLEVVVVVVDALAQMEHFCREVTAIPARSKSFGLATKDNTPQLAPQMNKE